MLQVRLQNITKWKWILFCGIYIAIIHSRFLSLLLDCSHSTGEYAIEPFIHIQNQLIFSIKITVPTTYNIVCFKSLLKHIKRIHKQKTRRWTENDSDQISCMPRSWFRIYWWRILSAEWSPSTRWRLASKVRFVLWQTIQYIKIKTKRIQMLLSITRWTATFRRYLRNRIRSRSI